MSQSTEHSTAPGHVHAVPLGILFAVFAALMVCTGLTVGVSMLHLPQTLAVVIAMVVAVIKAGLVALFFMHLWWDSRFNGLILIIALLFVALFITIALLDTGNYQSDMEAPQGVVAQ
jgi:cytochrome c oxidase subunit 4